MKLRQFLATLSPSDLRAIAQADGLRLPAAAWRERSVDDLAAYLTSRAGIDAVLEDLTSEEREALNDLIMAGGQIMARLFSRDHGAMSYTLFQDAAGTRPSYSARSAADGLRLRGLIFTRLGTVERWAGEVVEIPEDVLPLLPRVKKAAFTELVQAAPAPPFPARHPDVVRDIGALLCYLERESVRPVHVDRLSKRDLLKLNNEFSVRYDDLKQIRGEDDAPYLHFVHHLAQSLSLLQAQASTIITTEAALRWLSLPLHDQLTDAWQRFTKDGSWNDIAAAVEAQFVSSYPGPQHIVATRRRVINALKLCPTGEWLSIDSFCRALRSHDPYFLRTDERERSWSSWSANLFYGGWADVEQPFVSALLNSVFYWFGVVELGRQDPAGDAIAFRLTESGAVLLGKKPGRIVAREVQPITIQANFEIVAALETPPAVLFQLQRITELVMRDRASIYRLSPEAVWRHLQRGGTIEDVAGFLERASQRALPQNVAYSLNEWGQKHGEVTIDRVTLLTTSSEALMAQLRASKKLGLTVRDTLSPQAVTIDGDAAALVEQLRKAGFWPKAGNEIISAREGRLGGASLPVRTADLIHLLVSALLLNRVAKDQGRREPVPESLLARLSWQLDAAQVKQLQRLLGEAFASYRTSVDADD